MRVGFIADPWPWERQLPHGSRRCGDVEFRFDAPEKCDAVVVYGLQAETLRLDVPRERTIFVAPEPITVHRYAPEFLAQFGLVITTDVETPHPNRLIEQVGLPWHVGVWDADGSFRDNPLTVDDFRAFRPEKTKLVSVISSDKAFTPEHRARLAFVKELQLEFGAEIEVFGRGIADFPDKLDVLAPYRYHIALENCSYAHYWTEKVADPFLTLTYPIYYGAPDLGDYFPEESFTRIDITDPERAIAVVRHVLASDIDRHALPALEQARTAALGEHNLFALLARTVDALPPAEADGSCTIRPEAALAGTPAAERVKHGVKAGVRRALPPSRYEQLRRPFKKLRRRP